MYVHGVSPRKVKGDRGQHRGDPDVLPSTGRHHNNLKSINLLERLETLPRSLEGLGESKVSQRNALFAHLAFLPYFRINNLRAFNREFEFDSHSFRHHGWSYPFSRRTQIFRKRTGLPWF
jgi:hypothetical protein